MNQKLVVRVLLGVLALLLVAGMVVQFTPSLSSLNFGGAPKGTPALKVNGETVTAEDLEVFRRGNPVLSQARDGVLGEDFKTAIIEQKVRALVVTQAAKDVRVDNKKVQEQIQAIKDQRSIKTNKEWTDFLTSVGYTDARVRQEIRDSIAVQDKAKQIQDAAPKGTDAEAKLYYDLNPQAFATEPRIVGREIVVTDEKKAQDLLAQAKGGADFAKLASDNSTEFKDRGGALGEVTDGKIKPVGSVALPAEVSAVAFKLTSGGLTDVVKSGDKFYIVKVEQFLPAGTRSFADAKADALKAVETQKKNAAVEAWVAGLQRDAKVEVLDKTNWDYYNPTVATVGGQNIPYSEVLLAVVGNQQLGQLLQQGGDQAVEFVNSVFKPTLLTQIIDQYAAQEIVKNEKLPLSGSRAELLAGLKAYAGRDEKVTDAEIAKVYEAQKAQFQVPGSADVSEAIFADKAKALQFRSAYTAKGGDFVREAAKLGGTVSERGKISQGDTDPASGGPKLGAAQEAIFGGRLAAAGEGSVTDVVEQNGQFSVFLVTDLVKAETQPLAAVRDTIRTQLLSQKREAAGEAYVKKAVTKIKVENKLDEVIKAVKKRAEANAPKTPTNGTSTSGTSTSGTSTAGTSTATPNDAEKAPANGTDK